MTALLVLSTVVSVLGHPFPPVLDGRDAARRTGPAEAAVTPSAGSSSAIGGLATWYDDGAGYYAAAGPDLRAWLGRRWRGLTVQVSSGDRSVIVRLSDWCACGDRHGSPTLIDLSASAFRELAPLSRGVVPVTITTGVGVLPATDTAS